MGSVVYYPGYSQTQVHQNLVTQQIAEISNTYPMVVTTVNDHNYVAGMNVTFLIPPSFGMIELNDQVLQVIETTSNMLLINLDSTRFTPFAYPSPLPSAYTAPSVIPSSSGPYLPPLPLPFGNQDSFEGVIYNDGAF
jgi:hypothetical protein